MDLLSDLIQDCDVYYCAVADPLYLSGCFDDAPVWHNVAFEFEFSDLLVKFFVAILVLLPASAPARRIAVDLLLKPYQCFFLFSFITGCFVNTCALHEIPCIGTNITMIYCRSRDYNICAGIEDHIYIILRDSTVDFNIHIKVSL